MPAGDEGQDDDLYQFAETPAPPRAPTAPRSPRTAGTAPAAEEPGGSAGRLPRSEIKPTVVGYRSATEPRRPIDTDKLRDFSLPTTLLAGGVLVETLAAFLAHPHEPDSAGLQVAINLLLSTILIFVGLQIAAKIRGFPLGSFWTALLKVAAVAIAPEAAFDLSMLMLRFFPFGGLGGLLVEFCLYFALLGALFELDQDDTWYCICTIFVIRLGLYFGVLALHIV